MAEGTHLQKSGCVVVASAVASVAPADVPVAEVILVASDGVQEEAQAVDRVCTTLRTCRSIVVVAVEA